MNTENKYPWAEFYNLESGLKPKLGRRSSSGRPASPAAKLGKTYSLSQDEIRLMDELAYQVNNATDFTVTKSQLSGLALRLLDHSLKHKGLDYGSIEYWREFANKLFGRPSISTSDAVPWARLYDAEGGKPQAGKRSRVGRPKKNIQKKKRTFYASGEEVLLVKTLASSLNSSLGFTVTRSQVLAVSLRLLRKTIDDVNLFSNRLDSWLDIAEKLFESVDKSA